MHGRQVGKILIPNGSLQPVRIWFFFGQIEKFDCFWGSSRASID
jgi:hypothetical protein